MKRAPSPLRRDALLEVASFCLCQKARHTARTLTRFYDHHFAGSDIEHTQFNLLVALTLSQPVSVAQLASHVGIDRTTLTRNLALLQRGGFVTTARGKDARRRLLSLTEAGARALETNFPRWKRAQHASIAALGKEDFTRLSEALSLSEKLAESAENPNEN